MTVYLSCSLTVWRSCCGHAFFGYPPMVKWRYILIHWQNVYITIHIWTQRTVIYSFNYQLWKNNWIGAQQIGSKYEDIHRLVHILKFWPICANLCTQYSACILSTSISLWMYCLQLHCWNKLTYLLKYSLIYLSACSGWRECTSASPAVTMTTTLLSTSTWSTSSWRWHAGFTSRYRTALDDSSNWSCILRTDGFSWAKFALTQVRRFAKLKFFRKKV